MWIETLPEVGNALVARGREIEANKQRLRAELEDWLRAEARLWADARATGEWTNHELGDALVQIDPAAVKYLPSR
jgi:hypothetical protein